MDLLKCLKSFIFLYEITVCNQILLIFALLKPIKRSKIIDWYLIKCFQSPNLHVMTDLPAGYLIISCALPSRDFLLFNNNLCQTIFERLLNQNDQNWCEVTRQT